MPDTVVTSNNILKLVLIPEIKKAATQNPSNMKNIKSV